MRCTEKLFVITVMLWKIIKKYLFALLRFLGAMIEELHSNSYECMVCCDVIRHEVAVWSCTNCYRIYHLRCIKKWARSSMAAEGELCRYFMLFSKSITFDLINLLRC